MATTCMKGHTECRLSNRQNDLYVKDKEAGKKERGGERAVLKGRVGWRAQQSKKLIWV